MTHSLAGIDEAGRGAVLGPLIICLANCKRADERKLKKLCKKDSKQLSPKQREEILAQLKEFVIFKIVEIDAEQINSRMGKESLNDIEAKSMAELAKSVRDSDVIIDLPDRYEWTFRKRMERFGLKRFEAQHKADENFPVVAAASIQAKVMRDHLIEEIKKKTEVDFGSGYPSDPRTRKVLVDKDALKKIDKFIRKKWKTLETVKQRKLFDHEKE